MNPGLGHDAAVRLQEGNRYDLQARLGSLPPATDGAFDGCFMSELATLAAHP